jgi:predicted RNA-binding protein YlxR (DUF448 family)
MRTCVSCRAKKASGELQRLAGTLEDGIFLVRIDINKNFSGRGAWVCRRQECLDKLCKKGVLSKAFRKEARLAPGQMTLFPGNS